MGKHDMPTLEFTVERGRLVPAGPYEAEVLNTYRPGSKLTITLHQKRSLPLLKKYWAVMRDVVDQCKTPWNSPDEASDAIKLALGVTDIGKTVKGQWFIRPGSIAFTSMDEAAFREYFEKAMAILAEVTGIDPAELRQRYSHIAEADNSQSSDTPADDNGSDGKSPSPEQTVAADPSEPADEAEAGAGDIEARDEPDASPASEPIASDWLKTFAKVIIASIGPDETVVVGSSKGLFVEGLSDDTRERARAITNYARAVCRNEMELADALEIIAGKAGCEVEELR